MWLAHCRGAHPALAAAAKELMLKFDKALRLAVILAERALKSLLS